MSYALGWDGGGCVVGGIGFVWFMDWQRGSVMVLGGVVCWSLVARDTIFSDRGVEMAWGFGDLDGFGLGGG